MFFDPILRTGVPNIIYGEKRRATITSVNSNGISLLSSTFITILAFTRYCSVLKQWPVTPVSCVVFLSPTSYSQKFNQYRGIIVTEDPSLWLIMSHNLCGRFYHEIGLTFIVKPIKVGDGKISHSCVTDSFYNLFIIDVSWSCCNINLDQHFSASCYAFHNDENMIL